MLLIFVVVAAAAVSALLSHYFHSMFKWQNLFKFQVHTRLLLVTLFVLFSVELQNSVFFNWICLGFILSMTFWLKTNATT